MRKIINNNVGILIYMVVWLVMFCLFWIGKKSLDENEIGFAVIAFYAFLPASSLVVSYMYGKGNSPLRFLIPFVLAFFEVALGSLTFDLSNTLETGKWNTPDFSMALFSFIPALVGIMAGTIRKHLAK